jgi:prepilin-type N-terminal cleavage/methylation domain-containing protein
MKMPPPTGFFKRAFTLLEMSIVLMVLLGLMSITMFGSRKIDEWKLGRQASENLRSVYTAQRSYLADNPTASVASLTPELIIPYLPNHAAALPTVKSLNGATLPILVNVSPPVINAGSGITYDPSGCNNDSLWDVGE